MQKEVKELHRAKEKLTKDKAKEIEALKKAPEELQQQVASARKKQQRKA